MWNIRSLFFNIYVANARRFLYQWIPMSAFQAKLIHLPLVVYS